MNCGKVSCYSFVSGGELVMVVFRAGVIELQEGQCLLYEVVCLDHRWSVCHLYEVL